MNQTRYDGDLERLNRQAELLNEQIGLLQRLREIDVELGQVIPAATSTTLAGKIKNPVAKNPPVDGVPKRRGRPPKVKDGTAVTAAPTGVSTEDGKSVDLPTLLVTLAQDVNKPLLLPDFVTLAREAGYTTKAKDFSNMVYQAVLKLVKKGVFKKNDETRAYEFVKAAA